LLSGIVQRLWPNNSGVGNQRQGPGDHWQSIKGGEQEEKGTAREVEREKGKNACGDWPAAGGRR